VIFFKSGFNGMIVFFLVRVMEGACELCLDKLTAAALFIEKLLFY
jgi:hypothetical protein